MVDLHEIGDCGVCRAYFRVNGWAIINASASVGVEQNKSTREVVGEYMISFHAGGHPIDN